MFDRARTIGAALLVAALVALALAVMTRGGSDAPSTGAATSTTTTGAATTVSAGATSTGGAASSTGSATSSDPASSNTPAGCELIPNDVLGVILGDNVQASQAQETNPAIRQCFFIGTGGATLSIRVERVSSADKAKALATGFNGSLVEVASASSFNVGLGQLSFGATTPVASLFLSQGAIANGSTYVTIDVTNASSETSRTHVVTAGKALLANSWVKAK